MWDILIAYRVEWLTSLSMLGSWYLIKCRWHHPFWRMWLPGTMLGLAIEFMTEPEWTYSAKIYIWRDISPFVIIGWGIMFLWLVSLSDELYYWLYKKPVGSHGHYNPRILVTDLIIGLPLFLGNELFGLHILKVWKYNSVLNWDTIIPWINYPLEGFVAIIFFILAFPSAVRYWRG